jgi:hypothetical protein
MKRPLPVTCHGLERGWGRVKVKARKSGGHCGSLTRKHLRIGRLSQFELQKAYFEGKGGFEMVRVM